MKTALRHAVEWIKKHDYVRDVQLADETGRVSGRHQIQIGTLGIDVALVNFAPVELQRHIVDDAVIQQILGDLAVLSAVLFVALGLATKWVMLSRYRRWSGWLARAVD